MSRDETNPLYQLRIQAGYSNRRFARAVGISLSSLQRFEAGDIPSLPIARSIAIALYPQAQLADIEIQAKQLISALREYQAEITDKQSKPHEVTHNG